MPRKESPLPGVELLPDGRARALVYLGRDAAGKRRYTRRTFATVTAANDWKRDLLRSRDDAARPDDAGMTVAVLVARWLALPTDRRSPSTLALYRHALERHILPALGSTRLDRLSTAVLQRHVDGLSTLGIGPRSIQTAYVALSGALKRAVAWGLIARNPAAGVVLPLYHPENPATAIGLDDARRLLADVAGDEVAGPAIALMLLTGCRVGEVLALGWPAVDLDRGLLHVRRHLRQVTGADGWRWELAEGAKTRSGERTVKLSTEAVAILRRHRARQAAWRLALGADWPASDLAFTRPDGGALTPGAVQYALKVACRRLGIERLTPHDLRSTHTTLLAEAAAETELLALQRRLGHRQLSQTLDYRKPDAAEQAGLAERLDERLREPG